MNKEQTIIPIFFSYDNAYVVPSMVAINSLLENVDSNLGHTYKLYVVHSDIHSKNMDSIRKIVNKFKFATIDFINTQGFLSTEWHAGNFGGHNEHGKHQFCKETIYKCFAARLFPNYDRIIYSDVDVIFQSDISESYFVNIDSLYLAAVVGINFQECEPHFFHLPEKYHQAVKDNYFAGGYWVLNLKKIREDSLEQKMIDIINDDSITKLWPDQDIMNIACGGNILPLPLRYIGYADLGMLPDAPTFNYDPIDIYEMLLKPIIIHYAAMKPWTLQSSQSNRWWDEYDKIKKFVNDFLCYNVRRKKKIRFSMYRYLHKKLKPARLPGAASSGL